MLKRSKLMLKVSKKMKNSEEVNNMLKENTVSLSR